MPSPPALSCRRALLAAPALALPGLRPAPAAGGTGGDTLRIVVPFAPGGPGHRVAEALRGSLAAELGRPVSVEPRPSGRGPVPGSEHVFRAPRDGATLLFNTQFGHLSADLLFPGLPYDPLADFAAVSVAARAPVVLLVPARDTASGVTAWAEALRRRGGAPRFGSAGPGTGPHVMGQLLAEALGLPVAHQPFAGNAPAREALATGRLAFLVDAAPTALAGGDEDLGASPIRPLAVLGADRLPARPDLPALGESHPEAARAFAMEVAYLLLAPAGTPPETVAGLNAAARRAILRPEAAARLARLHAPPDGAAGPEALVAWLAAERTRLRPLVERALAAG